MGIVPELSDTDVLVVVCPRCPFVTHSLSRLEEHFEVEHSGVSQICLHRCVTCRKVTSSRAFLQEHLQVSIASGAHLQRCCFHCSPWFQIAHSEACFGSSDGTELFFSGLLKSKFPPPGAGFSDAERTQACLFCPLRAFGDRLQEHYSSTHGLHKVKLIGDARRPPPPSPPSSAHYGQCLAREVGTSATSAELSSFTVVRHTRKARVSIISVNRILQMIEINTVVVRWKWIFAYHLSMIKTQNNKLQTNRQHYFYTYILRFLHSWTSTIYLNQYDNFHSYESIYCSMPALFVWKASATHTQCIAVKRESYIYIACNSLSFVIAFHDQDDKTWKACLLPACINSEWYKSNFV